MRMKSLDRRDVLKRMTGLMGGGLSASVASGILSGVGPAQAAAFALQTDKHTLKAADMAVLAELADRIIPDTDTPGARAAGVPAYIHLMVSEWYYDDERVRFIAGLKSIDQLSRDHTGKAFLQASEEDRHDLMVRMDRAAAGKSPADNFFLEIKQLTLIGYFTSQIGAEEELRYEAVPGPYEGCVPLSKIGRAWAT
ncbi:hypothetical protein CRD36_01695 [Paremcibacter congregatus]|uniref:Twin-arginine translocation pathway signal n=2 Tax=Paremcibacter congregatus TaxID=2043170 RepID=A0A2G4YYT6_9PROT|nr:hypothetical protein CRD36_01695 [Paremcibacter congregatus]QDE26418.1 gluconate 2-dehydrogenase subunit 3 family protein [Paremcibacter congregatus]